MPAMPTRTPRSLFAVAAAALAATLLLAVTAVAAPPTYKGTSADGKFAFFETDEQLVPGDTDNKRDIYVRSFDETVGAYVTREISTGPTGGNDSYNALFERVSGDGAHAFFSTEEPLVAADTDRRADVYVRDLASGTTRLVSRGVAACLPGCGAGEFDSGFAAVSADGNRVFVVTAERLDPSADTDGAVDVYERDLSSETTALVSAGASACAPSCGNGDFNATLRGLSADGSRAFFATAEKLVGADGDGALDIYAHDVPGGPTALISAGDAGCAPCGNSASAAVFAASSVNGDVVYFSTDEALVAADTDGANDVYRRVAGTGTTTLVSGGSATQPASFAASTDDGSRVFFVSAESLAGGADSNGANDVYSWQGGSAQLLTSGSGNGSTFGAIADSGDMLFFTTTEALSGADTDTSADIYAQSVGGGSPVLVSAGDPACSPCGSGAVAARFNRASDDGDRVFFTTDEALSPQDFDGDDDIYARALTLATTALSTPPPGLCPTSACDATFVDASAAADHVFFQTTERLVADDVDSEPDIYERAFDAALGAETTRLVSTGNDPGLDLGPAPPLLQSTNPASPGASTEPAILGSAEAGSAIKIYPTPSCSGEPVATGSAEQLSTPGIKVAVAVSTSKTFWATADAEGFTSLCSSPITYKQEAATSPPGGGGGGGGGGAPPSGGAGGGSKGSGKPGFAYVTPVVKITFGPIFKTRAKRPEFRFTDSTKQPETRFECRVDRSRWKRCRSPLRLKGIGFGRHLFRVRAINAVGVDSVKPATRAFKRVKR